MTISHHDHSGHSGGRSPSRGGVSRRQFLAGAAGVGALAIPSGRIAASSALASTRAGQAGGLPSMQEVWGWQEQLVRFGTRYTGSPGHAAYVDWLTSQLAAVPGFTVQTDRLTFNRWLARDYALQVSVPSTVGASGPVPLTYYYPYSGQTPPDGVTARLVDLGTYPPAVPGSVLRVHRGVLGGRQGRHRPGPRPRRRCSRSISGRPPPAATSPARPPLQAAADYTAYAAALPILPGRASSSRFRCSTRATPGCSGSSSPGPACPTTRSSTSTTRSPRGYPAASGLPTAGRPRLPGGVGRRRDRRRTVPAGRQRSGQRDPRAHRRHHRRRGDRDGLGAAEGLRATPARTSSSTRTPTGRTPPRRTAGSGCVALARYLAGRARAQPRHVLRPGHRALPAAAVHPDHPQPQKHRGRQRRDQRLDARPPRHLPGRDPRRHGRAPRRHHVGRRGRAVRGHRRVRVGHHVHACRATR